MVKNMIPAGEQKGKETEFVEFASKAIRRPKAGVFEHLLGQHLAASVTAAPSRKIQLTCEACMLLDEKQRKDLDIDVEEVQTIYSVVLSFRAAILFEKQYRVQVAWNFPQTKENFAKYVKPWLENDHFDFWYTYEKDSQGSFLSFVSSRRIKTDLPDWILEVLDQLKKGELTEQEADEKYIHTAFFWASSSRLTSHGYRDLLGQFIRWALPKTQAWFAKLTQLVSPSLYNEILRLYAKPAEAETK